MPAQPAVQLEGRNSSNTEWHDVLAGVDVHLVEFLAQHPGEMVHIEDAEDCTVWYEYRVREPRLEYRRVYDPAPPWKRVRCASGIEVDIKELLKKYRTVATVEIDFSDGAVYEYRLV